METKAFFDPQTYTLTYVVFDSESRDAVVIDPVLDFDPLAWRTSRRSADQVRQFVAERSLDVRMILDTHAHADHLSGMDVLREALGAPTAIGEKITAVQAQFAGVYNLEDLPADGSQWDLLLADGQVSRAGSIEITALATPGHTPACMTYQIGDALFTGDALFMPDYGTGRCDFPGGSASDLYDSITRLYRLPDSTRVLVGHDYQPNNRELAFETTIGASKESNVRLRASTSRSDFIANREARDRALSPPRLLFQSLVVNINAGRLPEPESNGRRYLKMPLDALGSGAPD